MTVATGVAVLGTCAGCAPQTVRPGAAEPGWVAAPEPAAPEPPPLAGVPEVPADVSFPTEEPCHSIT
jgi:hypothetical protein